MPLTNPVTKQKLESLFRSIIGEPPTYMTRYVGCQQFQFGVQRPAKNRKGEDTTQADWLLVISCDWSLTQQNDKIVSSGDFGPKRERRDAAITAWI